MNDLAEKALQGARAVGCAVRDRPMRSFAVAGLAVGVLAVLAGGRVSALSPSRPLTTWLDIASAHTADARDHGPAVVLLVCLAALVLLWVALVETVRRQRTRLRDVWAVAGVWALPFVLGPPFMDTSAVSYVAYGRIVQLGGDPYVTRPSSLGSSAVVSAMAPSSRGEQSAAGPLGTALQHLANSVAGGRLVGSLLVLRAIGVLAAIAIGRGTVRLASSPRSAALALCLPNPLVLLYAVSSPHLEAVTIAVLLSAAVAARRRSWTAATTLATIAGTVAPVGLVAVPVIVAAHLVSTRRKVRALALDGGATVLVLGVVRLAVPDGFGWLRTARGQFDEHTPFSIADATGRLIGTVLRGAASVDDLAAGGRVTAAVAAVSVIVYLVVTVRSRGVDTGIGFALLALALLAPVLHPWYLMWGLLVFAPSASGSRRIAVLALSAAACLLTPPGFPPLTSHIVTVVELAVVAALTAVVLRGMFRAGSAGDVAHGRPDVGEIDPGDHDRHEGQDAQHT